jgi:hypothetical protein
MAHDCLDEFLTLKMEEHTSVGVHLAKMHRIHRCLVIKLGYEISDASTNSAVLCSLPPSYRRFVKGLMMGGESVTYHELVERVRT